MPKCLPPTASLRLFRNLPYLQSRSHPRWPSTKIIVPLGTTRRKLTKSTVTTLPPRGIPRVTCCTLPKFHVSFWADSVTSSTTLSPWLFGSREPTRQRYRLRGIFGSHLHCIPNKLSVKHYVPCRDLLIHLRSRVVRLST